MPDFATLPRMLGREFLHYKIREKIGEGGMGEVYLAHDAKLDREVAIKFIPPSLQSSPEAKVRLLREAQAASRLTHPNIVSIFAIEQTDEYDFIVMEYVRGRTLSDVINAGTLTIDQALDLARQIADAMSVAHEAGVVHRDIKSSNILVTDRGQAKMLDFGLATFYGATQVTDVGSTMGTASYMSPEQTQGRPIDHRSDLFSFGVVMYEMIAGRRPFDGENRNTIAYAICNHTPEPLARFKTGVPASLEAIVSKAMRKDPTERYQSAADMMADIRVAARESGQAPTGMGAGIPPTPQTPSQPYHGQPQTPHAPQPGEGPYTPGAGSAPYPGQPHTPPAPGAPYTPPGPTPSQPVPPYAPESKPSRSNMNPTAIAAIVMGGLIAIAAIVTSQIGGDDTKPAVTTTGSEERNKPATTVTERNADDRVRIAVLPFANQGDDDDQYFADGITEEITARLASVKDLGVIGRTSVEAYKDSRKSPQEIGRDLKVDYVLEGTVRWQRDGETSRVRVTPQLVRASDGVNVWADVYDEPMTAVFKVQSSIAKAVVGQLDIAIHEPEQAAMETAPTENMEAYDAYLKGMRLKDLWNSAKDMRVAVSQFEKATALDPDFLMAFVRLSEVNADMVWFKHDQSEHRVDSSRRAAERALAIDSDAPEARWAMGWYYYHAEHDLKNALRYLEPVLAERPSADAHAAVAWVQRRQGRWQDAIDNLERAVELNPNEHNLWYSLGECYSFIGEYPKARAYLDRCVELRPEFPYGRTEKILTYILEGNLLKARTEAQSLTDVFGFDEYGHIAARVEYLLGETETYFEISAKSGPQSNNAFYRPRSLSDALVRWSTGNAEAVKRDFTAARDELITKLAENPDDFRVQAALGIAYAGLGAEVDALRHAEKALKLLPPATDALRATDRRLEYAKVLILLGDYDAAIDQLEIMVSTPGHFSDQILRKDRFYGRLRDMPRFKALLGAS